MKISEILAGAAGLASPLEARVLLKAACGITDADIIADKLELDFAPDGPLDAFCKMVFRRSQGEPVAYIIGRREFYGREFKVGRGVLIPRPDSETLIDAALGVLGKRFAGRILDLGVGSGALLFTLLLEFPDARGDGIDICPTALDFARRNLDLLGLKKRARIIRRDLRDYPIGGYGLVVANPPYVPAREIEDLAPDVKDYEPRAALDGGADGLDYYRAIAARVPSRTKLLLEVGEGQADAVAGIFAAHGKPRVWRDLAGRARVVGFNLDK